MRTSNLSEFHLPVSMPRPVLLNDATTVAEGVFRPVIHPRKLAEELREISGVDSTEFQLPTRIFEFDLRKDDSVIASSDEGGLPLLVVRDGEIIVNFDIDATRKFHFADSKRPIYTYIPGFNVQMIPPVVRRPVSNFIQSLFSRGNGGGVRAYEVLPLTSFDFILLLLRKVMTGDHTVENTIYKWPSGKRSAFLSFHDVDTSRFFQLRERDPLFRLEQQHGIRSTWFIPTVFLPQKKESIDFLLGSGGEVGWHGYKHDHRLPFKPFTDKAVRMLKNSYLSELAYHPLGMRSPKLLKSNYLFELLDQLCPALSYDTSFSRGIAPYYLWVNGRKTGILEIPITVPTDIAVYNAARGIPTSRRFTAILDAQIARTKKLLEVGGIVSIVTHPEKDLTERPEFLEIYDQYLKFITGCPEIWFATAGELFRYWTHDDSKRIEPSGDNCI